MSILVLTHVATGLCGIAAGIIAVVGIHRDRRMAFWNALFFFATTAACGTGFVFLPSDGVTSAQLVGFFVIALLVVAAYARYRKQLAGPWRPVYALIVVGVLFLNVLITTAQSFVHVPALTAIAPTQESPLFVAVKVVLLLIFVPLALFTARRVHSIEDVN